MRYYMKLNEQGIAVFSIQIAAEPTKPDANLVEVDELHTEWLGQRYDREASVSAGKPVFVAVEGPPQEPDTGLSELEFRGLFTQNEKRAIYAAAAVEIDVQIWLDDLRAMGGKRVMLTDQRTVAGVQAMEAIGIITQGRATQILMGTPANEV